MAAEFAEKRLDELFVVKSGDYHAANALDPGHVPLVSCGDANNGVIGYYDIPDTMTYQRAITSAYNGQPLTTKFHPYEFAAKDDVAVLIPRRAMKETTLVFIAALLNMQRWRYSYGRKCYREKMYGITLSIPVAEDDEDQWVDEDAIAKRFSVGDIADNLLQSAVAVLRTEARG